MVIVLRRMLAVKCQTAGGEAQDLEDKRRCLSAVLGRDRGNESASLLRRTVATIKPKISGVQVHTFVAIPGPPHAWDPDHQETDPSTQPS